MPAQAFVLPTTIRQFLGLWFNCNQILGVSTINQALAGGPHCLCGRSQWRSLREVPANHRLTIDGSTSDATLCKANNYEQLSPIGLKNQLSSLHSQDVVHRHRRRGLSAATPAQRCTSRGFPLHSGCRYSPELSWCSSRSTSATACAVEPWRCGDTW